MCIDVGDIWMLPSVRNVMLKYLLVCRDVLASWIMLLQSLMKSDADYMYYIHQVCSTIFLPVRKSPGFFQIFKAWKVLENRHGPRKALNLYQKVLESAGIRFSNMLYLNLRLSLSSDVRPWPWRGLKDQKEWPWPWALRSWP